MMKICLLDLGAKVMLLVTSLFKVVKGANVSFLSLHKVKRKNQDHKFWWSWKFILSWKHDGNKFSYAKKKKMSEQILFSSYNEIPYSNLKNLATGMGLKIIRINEKSKLQK